MKRNEIFMRDPFLYVEDGIGYLVGTTCKNAWSGPATSFLGYTTTDLENFEGPFVLFENNDEFWAEENFWAPELHKYDGKYYLIASFYKKGKCRASQMLVSDTPMGKYIPLAKPFTPENWECLDATIYEEDGKLYTIFCHEFLQTHDGEMCLAELNEDLISLKTEPKVLFKASWAPWVVSHDNADSKFTNEDFVTDGPFIHKLENGKLLMLWSSDGKDGYAMGMAISSNGIKGPWSHFEKPLFGKDGGHGMYFEFKGKKYISLHHPNMPFLSERPYFFEVEEKEDKLSIK
jgi:GH43 family beta-xylosidase